MVNVLCSNVVFKDVATAFIRAASEMHQRVKHVADDTECLLILFDSEVESISQIANALESSKRHDESAAFLNGDLESVNYPRLKTGACN
jgi:hypothetical protein